MAHPALKAVAAGLLALTLTAPELGAEGVILTPDEMRATGVKALKLGQPVTARRLADALLIRDPNDIEALLIRAKAARAEGDTKQAKADARRAWRLSQSDENADPRAGFAAARTMAQALSTEGNQTAAQWWLRRAAQNATDDRERNTAIRDFRYVKSVNPWSGQLRFNVAPNSNFNNGSSHDRAQLFDQPFELPLPASLQALSGMEYAVGATVTRTLGESTTHRTQGFLSWDSRRYTLSSDAKAKAPGVSPSAYAFDSLRGGVNHTWLSDSGRLEYRLGGAVGKTRYGGQDYARQAELDFGTTYGVSETARLRFGIGVDKIDNVGAPGSEAWTFSTGYSDSTKGGIWSVGLNASLSSSARSLADYEDVSLEASYTLAKPLFGAQVQFGVDMRTRHYDRSAYTAGARSDKEVGASVGLVFNQVDYYGFSPVLTLRTSKADSNVDIFDTTRTSAQFGIASSF